MNKQTQVVKSAFDEHAAFVDEGAVVLRELGYEGLMPPIPAGECAIQALVPAADGKVYGLTKGAHAHLFVYYDFPMEDCVLKLGVVGENVAGGDLMATREGLIYGLVSGESGGVTGMFRYDPSKDAISGEQSLHLGKAERVNCPFAGRVISRLVTDAQRGVCYGLFLPENKLFSYEFANGRLTELGGLGEGRVSTVLCVGEDGVVYGAAQAGEIFCWRPETGRLDRTGWVIPCGKGKQYVSTATALVYDAAERTIYGGTNSDGYLFKVLVDTGRVVCLGKPIEQRPIRCLTVGNDGLVFGLAGEPGGGFCHLFRYDPETGDLRDLGIPRATITKAWVAHEIDALCTNRNGHLVMGENDRMAHLLIYFPPVPVSSRRGRMKIQGT